MNQMTLRRSLTLLPALALMAVTASATPQEAPTPRQTQPSAPARQAPSELSAARIEAALEEAHAQFKNLQEGENADYIPALDEVDPNLFGIALVTADGRVFTVGDAQTNFSIQSIAKPFTLAEVIEERGPDFVEEKIGVDPTGQPFNSLIAIEQNEEHRAGNPLVNAGAIASVSQVPAQSKDERWQKIAGNLNDFAGRKLGVDQEIYKSETDTNTRNQSITRLLENYEVLGSPPEQALDLYTRQSSVNVTAKDLAVMGATLANGGVNPVSGERVVKQDTAKRVLAVMATSGLYENTGQWLYDVGVPAKSGVGGGIVAVVPGEFGIAAFSPRLDEAGNSVRAQRAIEHVVNELNANPYVAATMPSSTERVASAGGL